MRRNMFLCAALVLGLFFLAGLARAESPLPSASPTLSPEAQQAIADGANAADAVQDLDGVNVADPKNAPGSLGLYWRNFREWVVLSLTTDPAKKAEKQLLYAQERIKLAEYMAENSTDPKLQEKAQSIIAKANDYIEKVNEKKADLLARQDEQSKKLIANLAKFELNQERVLAKLEDKLPVGDSDKFQQFRAQMEQRIQERIAQLQKASKLPADVQQQIEAQKKLIQEKMDEAKTLREQNKDLVERAKAGDDAARAELEKLKQARIDEMKKMKEAYQAQKQAIIDKLQTGNKEAIQQMKVLNQTNVQAKKEMNVQYRVKIQEAKRILQQRPKPSASPAPSATPVPTAN